MVGPLSFIPDSSFWFLSDKTSEDLGGQGRNWRGIKLSLLAEDSNGGYFPDTFVHSRSKRGIVIVSGPEFMMESPCFVVTACQNLYLWILSRHLRLILE
ncbi:hypothetical protein CDAR_84921 [Caerostris darwini]|uniref:Uncharacterized protein n=1 Tax=Caerostris darwini TaxID=1538125 RepID=A0AAV4PNE8_9ARAC|nr:hypothetical protein CDAR_84921 [Caerostris darwini]